MTARRSFTATRPPPRTMGPWMKPLRLRPRPAASLRSTKSALSSPEAPMAGALSRKFTGSQCAARCGGSVVQRPRRSQAPGALRLAAVARHRAARRFGPAVVVEVGTRQVARPDLGGDRPVDGVRDERLARLGERALGQAIALRGAARCGEGEGEREARDA